jgi:hypothetical protein
MTQVEKEIIANAKANAFEEYAKAKKQAAEMRETTKNKE